MTSSWEALANNSMTASETQTARVRKRIYNPISSTNNNSSSLVNIWVSNFYSSVNRWTSSAPVAKITRIRASDRSSRVPTCHHSSTHSYQAREMMSSKSTSAPMNHDNICTNMMTQILPHTAGVSNTLRKRSNNSPSLQSWASCSKITLRPYEVIRILDDSDDSEPYECPMTHHRVMWTQNISLKNRNILSTNAGQCEVSVQATIESLVELLKIRGFQNALEQTV